MKFILVVSFLALFSSYPLSVYSESPKNNNEGDVSHYISRAENMYSCYEYFRVAGSQRKLKEEKKRYKKFAKKSEKYGKKLLKLAGIKGQINEIKYKGIGRDQNITWIKEIGKDTSGEKLNQVTLDCVKSVQREELAASL